MAVYDWHFRYFCECGYHEDAIMTSPPMEYNLKHKICAGCGDIGKFTYKICRWVYTDVPWWAFWRYDEKTLETKKFNV